MGTNNMKSGYYFVILLIIVFAGLPLIGVSLFTLKALEATEPMVVVLATQEASPFPDIQIPLESTPEPPLSTEITTTVFECKNVKYTITTVGSIKSRCPEIVVTGVSDVGFEMQNRDFVVLDFHELGNYPNWSVVTIAKLDDISKLFESQPYTCLGSWDPERLLPQWGQDDTVKTPVLITCTHEMTTIEGLIYDISYHHKILWWEWDQP